MCGGVGGGEPVHPLLEPQLVLTTLLSLDHSTGFMCRHNGGRPPSLPLPPLPTPGPTDTPGGPTSASDESSQVPSDPRGSFYLKGKQPNLFMVTH